MTDFATKVLPDRPDVTAPDGASVRILLNLEGGSMAHFELQPDQTTTAVAHRTVAEIWYVIAGQGEMWRKQPQHEEIVALVPGVCLTIPVGTHFQFRSTGREPLAAVAVTMPSWPGEQEARIVAGRWQPTGS
jgi:mannose-6-phosphate isomerase-like protein (cupin superfamily)